MSLRCGIVCWRRLWDALRQCSFDLAAVLRCDPAVELVEPLTCVPPKPAAGADLVEPVCLKASDEGDVLLSRFAINAHALDQHSLDARDWWLAAMRERDRSVLLPADEHVTSATGTTSAADNLGSHPSVRDFVRISYLVSCRNGQNIPEVKESVVRLRIYSVRPRVLGRMTLS
jgi:hypothetical protein